MVRRGGCTIKGGSSAAESTRSDVSNDGLSECIEINNDKWEQLYVSYSTEQTNLLRFNGSISFTYREHITERRRKAAQNDNLMPDK